MAACCSTLPLMSYCIEPVHWQIARPCWAGFGSVTMGYQLTQEMSECHKVPATVLPDLLDMPQIFLEQQTQAVNSANLDFMSSWGMSSKTCTIFGIPTLLSCAREGGGGWHLLMRGCSYASCVDVNVGPLFAFLTPVVNSVSAVSYVIVCCASIRIS